MLGGKLLGVIFKHIWVKDALIFVVVHDHWLDGRIKDVDGGHTVFDRFLNGEACHSFQKSGKSLLGGNKVSKGIEDQHIVSLVIRHTAIWLENVRMTADHNINALLHEESCPFFLIFGRHSLFFLAPVCNKDQYITAGLGFLDHAGNFGLIKEIDHIFLAFTGATVVGSVCIIQEGNLDSVYFKCFDVIGIFLCRMNAENRNVRIVGAPEVKGFFHKIRAVIIDVVGCRFNDIEACFDQSISDFGRCGERRIGADSIVFCGKDSFLVYHCNIRCLDLIRDLFINFVVVPGSGIILAGLDEASMVEIIADSDDACGRNLRFFGSLFGSSLLFFGSLLCFYFRFLD